jgi:hypothetical protein
VIDELIDDSPKKYLGRQVTPLFAAQWTFDDDRLEREFSSTCRDVTSTFLAGDDERLAC